jgi:hypothetical protein
MTFWLGILGSLILVAGSAYPEKKTSHPARSFKNWLFALGGLCMLIYSTLNYLEGGAIFFIFLQALVNVASVLMLTNVPDRIAAPLIGVVGLGLMGWSITLFEGINTLFFILGLIGIGIGYVLDQPRARNMALLLGSALIALFSFFSQDWIFFGLNVFFAFFCGVHVYTFRAQKSTKARD